MSPRARLIVGLWKKQGHTTRGCKATRSFGWLARQLGCSRQALHQCLALEPGHRMADLEAELSRLFPELPPWPPRDRDTAGLVPASEFFQGR